MNTGEPIRDVVESVTFFPNHPGRIRLRVLRHREPVLILHTESDPLSYGDVSVTFEGVKLDHCDLIQRMCSVKPDHTLNVVFYPRADLQGLGTKAEFTVTSVEEVIPPGDGMVLPATPSTRIPKQGDKPCS